MDIISQIERAAHDRCAGRSLWVETKRLNREELLGALIVQVDVLRKELRDQWDDSDD